MQNELNLTKLQIYYNRTKRYIDNNDLSIEEFETYYMLFKEFVFSGLFTPNLLKAFAESLLNVKLCFDKNRKVNYLITYYLELKSFLSFINSDEDKEKFSCITIEKTFY